MKTTTIGKPGMTRDTTRSSLTARIPARRGTKVSPPAAADQQVAEIERTFSVRWEW